ncbi:MAG: hypothetical protein EHM23_06230 [Acidobacteria bacterium]|nr:MAG: hypothetical protein EHM23_06230 [Acidobacteriota bacterium]
MKEQALFFKKTAAPEEAQRAYAPDVYASSVARMELQAPLSVVPGGECDEGDVVLVRVTEVNTAYPTVETTEVKEVVLERGNLLVGVLGNRKALRGFSGRPPLYLRPGSSLHLLNKGGVIGECTAFNRDLGWPARVEYIGTVAIDGRPLNLKHRALSLIESPLPSVPVILVMGTCMNAGKTTVCKQILRLFSEKGFTVHGGKVAGVACLQDTQGMRQAGAKKVLSFMDFGLPSTTEVESLVPVARSLVHYLAEGKPDFILLEMGDGILGGYQVASVFENTEFMETSLCSILCANDLMGVWGAVQWMNQHSSVPHARRPALVSGPVTDSGEGIRYIEDHFGITAANAFDSAGKMCTFLLESLMPWLKSA